MTKFFTWPSTIDAYLLLVIKVGLILSLFAPLVIGDAFYFPYIVPRNLYWRLIIEIIFCLYLFLLIKSAQWRPSINKGLAILFFFVLSLTISSLLGGSFGFSFWSNFERMDGLVTWLHILMYVIVLVGVLRSNEDWRLFFGISLVVACLVALYALAQEYNLTISFIKPSSGGSRLTASLGNAAYVGSYMFLHIVVASFLWFSNIINQAARRWVNLFYAVSLFLFVYILMVTQTRGAFLGLVLFIWLLAICYLWFSRHKRPWFYYVILAVSLASVLSIALLFVQKNQPWVQDVPLFAKLSSISITNDITTQSRLSIWKNSLSGVKDKPIFGWGVENFQYVFNKYFPTQIFHDASSETWFDRPHNILVQHLVEGGVVGLLLYLGVFIYLIIILYKKYRQGDPWFFSFFWIIFLLTFLFQDLFIFDSLNTNVIFYLILAYLFTYRLDHAKLAAGTSSGQKEGVIDRANGWWSKVSQVSGWRLYLAGLICFILMFAIVRLFVYQPYRANTLLFTALRQVNAATNKVEAEQAKISWQESWSASALGDKEKVQLLPDMFQQVVNNQSLDDQIKDDYFNFTNDNLSAVAAKYPHDIRLNMFLSNFYSLVSSVVPALATKNVTVLENMRAWAPQRPDIYLQLTNAYLSVGQVESAKKTADQLKALAPWAKEVYWNEFLVSFSASDIAGMTSSLQAIQEFNQQRTKIDFDSADQSKIKFFINLAEQNKQTAIVELLNKFSSANKNTPTQ